MTDPTGRSFLSYRRSRSEECGRLINAQRERGIPTWRDVDDLNTEPTERELRRVLRDDGIANVVLWMSPETAGSLMIRNVEAPIAFERHGRADGFFVVPVAAGGLGYQEAAEAIRNSVSLTNIANWNTIKLEADPATDADISRVANQVLKQRLQAIDARLPQGEPLRISFNTRGAMGPQPGSALLIDWSHRFVGDYNREATAEDWQRNLLPALTDARSAVEQVLAHRKLLVSGFASLPATTALGFELMATSGIETAWEQRMPDGNYQIWSLSCGREDAGFSANILEGELGSDDLAVLVSVNNDVTQAVALSEGEIGPFRAYVHLNRYDSRQGAILENPGQAVDLARQIIEAARRARGEYATGGRVHLFMAVPAGLAMLVGQLLNTLGPVQTYEHVQSDAIGIYRSAALLNCPP